MAQFPMSGPGGRTTFVVAADQIRPAEQRVRVIEAVLREDDVRRQVFPGRISLQFLENAFQFGVFHVQTASIR